MRLLLSILFSFLSIVTFAQVTDDFSDGDFTNNPQWLGDVGRFQVNVGELQLFDVGATTDESQLYTIAPTMGVSNWEFYVRLDFNPSGSNFARVYLQSDQTDLFGSLNGYFVLIGGSSDVVELRRQTGTSTSSVISSASGTVATTPAVRIRVTRDATNNWELLVDYAGGTTFVSEGTATDATHPTGTYFGVRCDYTSTRSEDMYFDDFSINPTFADMTAPSISSVAVDNASQITVVFDEPIDATSAANASNFTVSGGITVTASVIDPMNPNAVILTLSPALTNLTSYTVAATADDLFGNTSTSTPFGFTYSIGIPAQPFDIIINEVFPDPSPVVGLPSEEFVELYNRSSNPIDLDGYELSSGSTPQVLPPYIMLPGEYVVVVDDTDVPLFTSAGIMNTIGVTSFNSLTNGGDNVTLTDDMGVILSSVDYDISWYQDGAKDDGGYTLELINPSNPCDNTINNWTASLSPTGGTPGQANSVLDTSTGAAVLQLASANVVDPTQVELTFTSALDNTDAMNIANYSIDNGIGNPSSITIVSPSVVIMNFAPALSGNVEYNVIISGMSDCAGISSIDPAANTATFALPLPVVLSALAQCPAPVVEVVYDVPMDAASAGNISNYNVSGIGSPTSVNVTGAQTAELTFGSSLTNGTSYDLMITGVMNTDGTIIDSTTVSFVCYEPVTIDRYDLIINEIFPNPSETPALEEAEFIEIYNRSNKVISLQGFSFLSGTSSSDLFGFTVLNPGDYIIIYEQEAGIDYSAFGNALELGSNIGMSNDGDDVALLDSNGNIIDAIVYDKSWYRDTAKDDGGYSIERINPSAPCEGANNWRVTSSDTGGTPGQMNSILDDVADTNLPDVLFTFPTDATTLLVDFTEALDAVTAADIANYSIDNGINIVGAVANATLFNTVTINLDPNTPLQPGTVYTLTIASSLNDCVGNAFGMNNTSQFGLPETVEEGDVVINEILFDPATGGSDFLELYNNSNKVINIGEMNIVNDTGGSSEQIQKDYLLFPQSYVVITEDKSFVEDTYNAPNPELIFKNPLPTFSTEGNVTLFVPGVQVDKFDYNADYHFDLLDDTKGVSLERIDPSAPTNFFSNWHSASESVGFATPTYLNSQFVANPNAGVNTETFTITENTFSPNNDGYKDFLRLDYEIGTTGYTANVKVFDAKGRMVRNLIQNELLGTNGFFQWDGLNDEGGKARIGIYILWVQVFDLNGNVEIVKKTCVLAGQF